VRGGNSSVAFDYRIVARRKGYENVRLTDVTDSSYEKIRAAFGLGEDDKHIPTVDADGVALAAIQALYKLSLEKDEKIEQLSQEVMELRARLARLEYAAMKK
jgi:hypothetical protein